VPTDTAPSWSREATRFTLRLLAWTLGLFALLRLGWVENHLVLPLTEAQGRAALAVCGRPTLGVTATLACSGADALALCLGAILAYPTTWRRRLSGAALGTAFILGLNIVRIATLGRAMTYSEALFDVLHVYVWPGVLTLLIAGYVFTWMRLADRAPASAAHAPSLSSDSRVPLGRFLVLAALLVVAFVAVLPVGLESTWILAAGGFVAHAAAAVLGALGLEATASRNLLNTARGGFVVTQECLLTPLIPIYLAAVLGLARSWRPRLLGLAATVPLFLALGVARLLILALPESLVPSPIFLVHAFFQLAVGVLAVALAAWWRHRRLALAARHAGLGLATGLAFAAVLGTAYTGLVYGLATALGTPPPGADPQDALAMLPAYQTALFLALYVAVLGARAWRWLLAGLAALELAQVLVLATLGALAARYDFTLAVRDVRGLAVAMPLVLIWLVLRRTHQQDDAAYRRFWDEVGDRFPDLGGAASTRLYRACEERLLSEHLPPLAGLKLFKTDLWDEAKNTRILAWAAGHGARPFGVDLSEPTVRQARTAFVAGPLGAAVADLRQLPYPDAVFDAIYSMGTIEHFSDPERALAEMFRVLRPGGSAIVGVPNRHDVFLRPVLAAALQAVGLYDYGYEKSFSRRALRHMLSAAGFEVRAESGILFIPGALRMLDLVLWTRARRLAPISAAMVAPFSWLEHHVPWLRRHGYLLATVAIKPAARAPAAYS